MGQLSGRLRSRYSGFFKKGRYLGLFFRSFQMSLGYSRRNRAIYNTDANKGIKVLELHPELSRNTGAAILDMIYRNPGGLALIDSEKFAANGIHCEWGYVIDLDNHVLEVYCGGSSQPISAGERFFFDGYFQTFNWGNGEVEKIYPIHFVTRFSIDDIVSDEEFVDAIKKVVN